MIIRALKSFAGSISMVPGQVTEVDATIAQDLIQAGYVEAVTQKFVQATQPKATQPAKKKAKKKSK